VRSWGCIIHIRNTARGVVDVVLPCDGTSKASTHLTALLQQFFNIAFLMGKPQDLPGGNDTLRIGFFLGFVSYLISHLFVSNLGEAIVQALVDFGGVALVFYVGLSLTNHKARFAQAYGGLCGATMFLHLAAIPVFWAAPAPGDPASAVTEFGYFLLLVWSLSLFAHVFRHTFDTNITVSILASLAWLFLFMAILSVVAPPTSTGTDLKSTTYDAQQTPSNR